MTIGDCSCYRDIKQMYFVWSLSAQILYSSIKVRPLQKKKKIRIHKSTLAYFLNLGTLHIEL